MLLTLALACAAPTPIPADAPAWTVLVYMNGDNDLELAALADLNELEQVGSSSEVTVLVQLDRSPDHTDLDGDWSGARRFRVEADGDLNTIHSPVLETLGPVDSGDPAVILDFVSWGLAEAPSDRVALVLWDHGTGWGLVAPEKGVSLDESTGSIVSLADGSFGELMRAISAARGGPLDLLGLDACWMMGWEMAFEAQDGAEVVVASQGSEPEKGWPYDAILRSLRAQPAMAGPELGAAVVQDWAEDPDSGPTLSALWTPRLGPVTEALDALGLALLEAGPTEEVWARTVSKALATSPNGDRDMGGLSAALQGLGDADVELTSGQLWDALDQSLLGYAHQGELSEATGLSIYAPGGEVSDLWMAAPWAEATAWGAWLAELGAP